MHAMKQYMLGLLAAAIICAVVNDLMDKKGANSTLIKMITGIFISVTMISPLVQLEIAEPGSRFGWISQDAHSAVTDGQNMARQSLGQVIKEQTEAYILDKAAFWELNLAVEVTLSESDPPVPGSVVLRGSASPYAKKQLSQWIAKELGITEDQQLWI